MSPVLNKLKKFALAATSIALVSAGLSVTPGNAVDTTNLFFNLNAGDPGSYNPTVPGAWDDLSSFSRNGTIVGSPTFNSGDSSLSFGGNTGLTSNNPSAAHVNMGAGFEDFTSGITVEFEGHFGSGVGPWERIFDFGNGASSDNLWVGSYATTNEIAVEVWKPNPTSQTNMGRCRSADSVDALGANTFAKIVITLDGSECHIYKNGVEVNSVVDGPAKQTVSGSSTYDTFYDDSASLGSPYPTLPRSISRSNNYIGRSNWGTDAAFDGAIKYVRIYTEAISPSDVAENSASYTLTYSSQGAEVGSPPTARTGNGLVTLASNSGNLSKPGYTFEGWATTAGQTSGITGSFNLTVNQTLYPAFAPISSEPNGGDPNDDSLANTGTSSFPIWFGLLSITLGVTALRLKR
jgi:uncharacterized repeat protein (TIGR02543 family)